MASDVSQLELLQRIDELHERIALQNGSSRTDDSSTIAEQLQAIITQTKCFLASVHSRAN